MKVFISWSGRRSEIVANALRHSLPVVLDDVEPWMSQGDLESGDRWAKKLAEELMGTNVGIVCLTRDNITSPWINFEAGCLAKQLDHARVVPYLIDLEKKSLTGPLSQFQAELGNQSGTQRLFNTIRLSIKRPSEHVFQERFDHTWPQLEKQLTIATTGLRDDPESDVAISLCYLLLQKRFVREVAERLTSPRFSRGLPREWLTAAAVVARFTGNRNTERLLRGLSVLEYRWADISAYEGALLSYARGATSDEITNSANDHSFSDPQLKFAFCVLRQLCLLEEGLPLEGLDLPSIELRTERVDATGVEKVSLEDLDIPRIAQRFKKVDATQIYCATQVAILAAARDETKHAETFFDIARRIPDIAGTEVSGYPFVQLLAPLERLFADTIAGVPLGPNKPFSDKTLSELLKEPEFIAMRGQLHVVARYAKVLASSNSALSTIERLSRDWATPLSMPAIRTRLGQLRKQILFMAGNP